MGGNRTAGMLAAVSLALMLAACGDVGNPTAIGTPQTPVAFSGTGGAGSPTAEASQSHAEYPTVTPRPSPEAEDWKTLPVVPAFGGRAAEIFRRGISMRRDFHAFSKIGDCQNITTYFLAGF
jgi:hypothetical protein